MNTDLAAQRAMDRISKTGFETVDESDRVLATVWLFESGVGNEGFFGYFSGRKGDLAFFAPTALRNILAPELAVIAEQANLLFGSNGPPRDQKIRRDMLRALPESARGFLASLETRYFACEEDADELMENYLLQHAASH